MSYILDALKRADTERERERGHVPGLHSQNLPGGLPSRDRKAKARPAPRRWVGVAILLVAVLVLAYVAWTNLDASSPETDDLAQNPATATTPPTTVSPTPGNSPQPAPGVGRPSGPNVALNRPPELPILAPPPPAPPSPPPSTSVAPATATATATAPAAAKAIPDQVVGAVAAPPAAPAPAAPAASQPGATQAPVRRFAELPADFRAKLPQVNISGSTYSSNPAQRTLIANGKMVQEGGEIAPGLLLETIGPRNAVLNFQGTRYTIGY